MFDLLLLYRRQYIAGPSLLREFVRWRHIKLSEALIIGCHPDLEVAEASNYQFWRSLDVMPKTLNDAAAEMADIIHGLIAAEAKRGDAALPLTEEYESRVSCSCAKELSGKLPPYLRDAPNTLYHDKLLF